jgi:hypothetical protein
MTTQNPDLERIAQAAADKAVKRVFENLGLDPADPDHIFELRRDLDFIRSARRGANHSMKLFFSGLLAALGMAAWLGWNAILGK